MFSSRQAEPFRSSGKFNYFWISAFAGMTVGDFMQFHPSFLYDQTGRSASQQRG
jgi:hypothetical protein